MEFRTLETINVGRILISLITDKLSGAIFKMVLVIVNKMINMTLLEPKVVVEWILSDEMSPEFTKYVRSV